MSRPGGVWGVELGGDFGKVLDYESFTEMGLEGTGGDGGREDLRVEAVV